MWKKTLALLLVLAMLVGFSGNFAMTVSAADADSLSAETAVGVAAIGDVWYPTLTEALAAAQTMSGEVTVEIYDKVTLNRDLSGSFDVIKFVGMDTDAEIYLEVQGYITASGKKVAFEDLTLSKSYGGFIDNAGFMNLAFGVYDVEEVTYTNCTFTNGAYAASGEVTYTQCKFYRSHDKYGLWAYGDVETIVDDCTFADYRGIKMYAEGAAKTVDLTVKDTDFSAVTDKPAIVLTYGESVTLEGNTYSGTGVFELDLDGAPNGTTVTSDVAPTCKNDNGACGVLVDGKIYTTVAQAAEVAEAGSKVTLLHDSTETVELPEGVILEKNDFDAAGVTVVVPAAPVAQVGGNYYSDLKAAIDAANAGDEIVILSDLADVDATIKNAVTINLGGKTLTDAYIIVTKAVTIKNGFIKNTNEAYPLVVQNGGELTIDNVAIEASKSDRAIWVRSGSDLVFNSGSILATKGENNTKTGLIAAIYTDTNTDVTINGGTITVDTPDNKAIGIYGNYTNANVTVNGGKISTSGRNYSYGIHVDGDITLTNGEIVTNEKCYTTGNTKGITNGYNYALNTALGNVTISGGTITTNGSSGYVANVGRSYNAVEQTITITGGTFSNNLSEIDKTVGGHSAPALINEGSAENVTATISNGAVSGFSSTLIKGDSSTLTISGGTFDVKINDAYLADGFELTEKADGTFGVGTIPPVKIGDRSFDTLEAAAAEAKAGDEIVLLDNVTEDVTLPAGVIFNGNGKQVGTITAAGEITFKGVTKATNFGTKYTNTTINIGEGACLELTGTGRMVIGHGCTFNITGTITDAKTADVASITPSLIAAGASFTGAGVNFNVTNAYIKFTAYCSSKNSNASGTYNFNITNSIWNQANTLVFSEPTNGMDPTVNFNLKDSVLNSTSHLVFAVTKGEIVFDNSNVNVGTSRQLENRSTMTIKNGSVVNGAVATSQNAINPGTIIVDNATYAVSGQFSGSGVGTGTLVIKKGATVSVGSIIDKANIVIDATGMAAEDTINFTGNLSKFAGTMSVTGNDMLDAKIVDGKIVLAERELEGSGTEADPFVIGSLDDLKLFAKKVNAGNNYKGKYIQLTADIDLNGVARAATNWEPIGTQKAPFQGNFDGNGKTVSNLVVSGEANVGFFGYATNAKINNLTINNATVTGTDCVGAIAGQVYASSTIDNCHVTGSIKIEGQTNVGGIVGKYYVKVSNSSVIGDGADTSYVKGVYMAADLEGDNIGGIMGHGGENNNFVGNTVKNITISGTRKVGGIVGIVDQQTDLSGCVVENVVIETTATADYANANLSTMSMGGLIGQYQKAGSTNNGTVTSCSVSGVTFENANGVTVSTGAIAGGARGGTDGMLAPAATIDASGTTVASVTGANNAYLFVAEIDGVYYTTLQAAIDAAEAGATVKLLTDVVLTEGVVVAADDVITLDLNGKTVSMETADDAQSSLILNKGNLTVTDFGENGKLSYHYTGTNSGDAYNTIESAPGSVLTIQDGTIENLSECLIAYAIDGLTNANGGDVTVNIEGGTITSKRQSVRIFANSTTNTGTLNISGGDITGRVIVQNANANANKAALTITGGTFNANEYKTDVLYVGGSNSATIDVDAVVSGGTFNGEITDTHVTGFISGGTFGTDVSEYCKSGYKAVKQADGTYGIAAAVEAYIVGDIMQQFASLSDAIEAVSEGGTVYLAGNVILGSQLDITKDVTINLNGKTLNLTAPGNDIKGDVTFTNGTIDVSGVQANGNPNCIISVYVGNSLTLDEINLVGSNYSTRWAVICAMSSATAGSTVNIIDSTVTLSGEQHTDGGFIKDQSGVDNYSVINIENSTLNLTNVKRGFTGAKVNITDSDVTITGGEHGINGSELTAVDSTITISGGIGRALTLSKFDVVIENSALNFSDMGEGEIRFKSANKLTVDADSTIAECDIYADVSSGAMVNDTEVTGNEDNMSTITNATVTNPAWAAKVGTTYYMDLAEAMAAAKAGDTVTILAGDYYQDLNVNKAITVTGEVAEDGYLLTAIFGKLNITADGATVKDLYVYNEDNAACIKAKDVLVEGCEIASGKSAFRSCYTSGTVTFKDSVIAGSVYGIHFDGSAGGNIVIDNCKIQGWTSFASTINKVTISDTEFAEGNYNQLRFYQDAEVTNTTFPAGMRIDSGNGGTGMEGINMNFTDCEMADGSDLVNAFPNDVLAKSDVFVDDVKLEPVCAEVNGIEYRSLQAALDAAGEGDTIVVLRDVTESIYELSDVTLTTNAANGVTITNTAFGWIGANNLNVGKGVTLKAGSFLVESGVNTIEGVLDVTTFYNAYDSKTIVQGGGKIVTSGMIVNRYHNNADAGIYVYGDGDDSTVEISCGDTIGTYSGTFYAKDAVVESNMMWIDYKKDSTEEADKYSQSTPVFENSIVNVTSEFRLYKDAILTLTGSTVNAGKVQIRQDATPVVTMDDNSVVKAATVENLQGAMLNAVLGEDGTVSFVPLVASVNGKMYATLQDALNAVKAGGTITLLDDVTITEDWDCRLYKNTGAVTIEGNDHTIKFTGKISDGANHVAAFRFEAPATVKDLTIDVSEATSGWGNRIRAISTESNLTVAGCTFIGTGSANNTRAIIFGETTKTLTDVEVSITNSAFEGWRFGVSDGENGKVERGVKAITVDGNTFTDASAQISASDIAVFTNNTVAEGSYVSITSYADETALQVTATGNTMTAHEKTKVSNAVNYDNIQDEFVISAPASVTSGETVTYFNSLAEAIAAAQAGETVTLLADVADAGAINLPTGVILDGNGKTISGNTAVYVDAAGATIKNVAFENISNGDSLSAIYANGLTGKLVVEGCTFNGVDWDSIQVTPTVGAVIEITGNTFKGDAKRYVHIETTGNADFAVTVTGNKMYNADDVYPLDVYSFKDAQKAVLSGNYIQNPNNICVKHNGANSAELALPLMNEDLTEELRFEAMSKRGDNVKFYTTIYEAVADLVSQKPIDLLTDVELTETLTIDFKGYATINGNGHKITIADSFNNTNCALMLGNTGVGDRTGYFVNLNNIVFDGIDGAAVIRSQGATLNATGCTFQNCEQTIGEAMIRVDYSRGTFTGCEFQNNKAVNVIRHNANADDSTNRLKLEDCTFSGNTCSGVGMIETYTSNKCELIGNAFTGNTAANAMVFTATSTKITGNYFAQNTYTSDAANKASVLAGPWVAGDYTMNITGNAFADANVPGVWAEDWSEQYGANATFDLSGNYWGEGKTFNYGVTGDPEVKTTSYSSGYTYENGVLTLTEATEVAAKIGDTYYETLQAAIDAAGEGDTVTVICDVTLTEGVVIATDDVITLDLNGKTVSMVDASSATVALLKNNGNLTIKDSVGGGKLSFNTTTPSNAAAYASNTISNYGTLTVESGIIENTTVGSACYALDNYAGSTATINGGELIAEKTAVRVFNWTNGDAAKSVLNVNGGIILSKDGYGINFNMGNAPIAELNITGGAITTNDTDYNLAVYVISQGSAEHVTIDVTDGTFNGYFALNGKTCTTMAEGNVSITGGTFEGVTCYGTPAYGFVSGGSYRDSSVEDYLADDCSLKYSSGWFSVEVAPVASVDGETFTDLQAAIDAAAESSATVYLLKDVTLSAPITVDGAITLNLKGKTITTAVQPAGKFVDAFTIMADVTITGEGTVDARPSNGYAFYIGDKAGNAGNLTIENGNFYGETSVAQVTTGSLNIKDGYFEVDLENATDSYKYVLNCWDTNFKNGTAKISVAGGTFKNFNPVSNDAEGKETSFMAEGLCAADEDNDGIFTVHEEVVIVDAAVAPTCTETGLTEGSHCECGRVIVAQEIVEVQDHSYSYENITGDTHDKVCDLGGESVTEDHTYTDGFCACGAEEPVSGPAYDANLKLSSVSLSLQESVCMQFIYLKSSQPAGYDVSTFYLEYTQMVYNKETGTFEPETGRIDMDANSTSSYAKFTRGFVSWAMTEEITITIYGEKDGVLYRGESYTTTVEKEAMTKFTSYKNGGYDAYCTVVADMLNYGAAVQQKESYNTANLANANFTDEHRAYETKGTPAASGLANGTTGEGTINPLRVAMSLQDKVILQVLIRTTVMTAPENYEVRFAKDGNVEAVIDCAELEPTSGVLRANFAVRADSMSVAYTITIHEKATGTQVSNVNTFSVVARAEELYNDATYSAQAIALVKYGNAVNAAFG